MQCPHCLLEFQDVLLITVVKPVATFSLPPPPACQLSLTCNTKCGLIKTFPKEVFWPAFSFAFRLDLEEVET